MSKLLTLSARLIGYCESATSLKPLYSNYEHETAIDAWVEGLIVIASQLSEELRAEWEEIE